MNLASSVTSGFKCRGKAKLTDSQWEFSHAETRFGDFSQMRASLQPILCRLLEMQTTRPVLYKPVPQQHDWYCVKLHNDAPGSSAESIKTVQSCVGMLFPLINRLCRVYDPVSSGTGSPPRHKPAKTCRRLTRLLILSEKWSKWPWTEIHSHQILHQSLCSLLPLVCDSWHWGKLGTSYFTL